MTVEGAPRTPSLAELLATVAETARRSVNVALPGRVEKYYASEQKADVKPLIQDLTADRDGNEILEELPVIPGVPVVFPRAGSFFVSLPIRAGDLVLLIVCDRSVDKYKSGRGTVTNPDDFRSHDWSDAVALPGFYPFGKSLGATDSANIVIGEDGLAADFVALAQKVLDELNKIDTAVSGHTHDFSGVTASSCTAGGATGTCSGTTGGGPIYDPASVAASRVKAT